MRQAIDLINNDKDIIGALGSRDYVTNYLLNNEIHSVNVSAAFIVVFAVSIPLAKWEILPQKELSYQLWQLSI